MVVRSLAWTCFAKPKGRLTRCEHLNANGGVVVEFTSSFTGKVAKKQACEKCGAERELDDYWAKEEHDEAAIARRATAREIVGAFERAERVLRETAAAIEREEEAMSALLGERFTIGTVGARTIEDTLVLMRQEVWGVIANRLGLRQVMSIRAAQEFDRETRSNEPPPITEEHIARWSAHMLSNIGAMHQEAVLEIFNWLRPRTEYGAGKYKTNDRYELTDRVVTTWMVEQACGRAGYYAVRYDSQKHLTALENVFSALDGRGMANKATWGSKFAEAIKAAPKGVGETEYFAFKCFRNGNLHIRFKRPDLVAKVNAIAGGKNLRPTG